MQSETPIAVHIHPEIYARYEKSLQRFYRFGDRNDIRGYFPGSGDAYEGVPVKPDASLAHGKWRFEYAADAPVSVHMHVAPDIKPETVEALGQLVTLARAAADRGEL